MRRAFALVTVLLLCLTACGIPRDPDASLERAMERGELVVGASHTEPALIVDGDDVSGPEAELVEAFAASRSMTVRWVAGGEEALVRMLEHGDLDLMVGGLTDKTPWASHVGVTRPWSEDTDEYGEPIKRVVAARLGENAMISAFETFVDERGRA